MIQYFVRKTRALAVLCALMICMGLAHPASAQLDYDTYDIYQNGVIVGTIYVPQRGVETEVYSEYWVLFPGYAYPSQTHPVTTSIEQTRGKQYTSVEDFFATAPWGTGYRFVHVISVDTTTLPGRTVVPGT